MDDEPLLRRLLAATLEDGFRVLIAKDGREALALFEVVGDQIAAVVTDVRMPNLGGMALADAIRRTVVPPPPILFISGFGGGGELPGPFLLKPFSPDALLEAVQRLVGPTVDHLPERP